MKSFRLPISKAIRCFTEDKKTMCARVDLLVRVRGAATTAAHNRGPGHHVRVYVCREVLMDRIRRVIRPVHMDHAHFYPASRSAFISRFRPAEFVVLGLRLYLQNETRKHFSRKEWMESRDLSLSPFFRITSTLNVLNHLSQTERSTRVTSNCCSL